jgi:hypothetical protein
VVLVYTKRGAGYKVFCCFGIFQQLVFPSNCKFQGSVEDSVFLPFSSFSVQPSVGEDDYDWVESEIGF